MLTNASMPNRGLFCHPSLLHLWTLMHVWHCARSVHFAQISYPSVGDKRLLLQFSKQKKDKAKGGRSCIAFEKHQIVVAPIYPPLCLNLVWFAIICFGRSQSSTVSFTLIIFYKSHREKRLEWLLIFTWKLRLPGESCIFWKKKFDLHSHIQTLPFQE